MFQKQKQESPPAGNCTRHIPHSITCPRGYPSTGWGGGGYPSPVPGWANPSPVLGYPQPGLGYPLKGPGTRDLGKNLGLGYLLQRAWNQRPGKEHGPGVPTGKDLGPETQERTWAWGTHWKGPGTTDPGKNLGLGTPQKWPGTRHLGKNLGLGTPPPPRCGLANKLKILPSPILRMRGVVKNHKFNKPTKSQMLNLPLLSPVYDVFPVFNQTYTMVMLNNCLCDRNSSCPTPVKLLSKILPLAPVKI